MSRSYERLYIWRVIEVVITGLTRNQLSGLYRTKGSNPLLSANFKGISPKGLVPLNLMFCDVGIREGRFVARQIATLR